jgi:hypothetical protein
MNVELSHEDIVIHVFRNEGVSDFLYWFMTNPSLLVFLL